jgi:DNA invertase Pin-like site-specific DNA recombinase
MNVGYIRVSSADQNLDLQMDALKQAGCQRIFQDVASGAKTNRQGLNDAIEFCREGDVLTVWKLDRCGRSLSHLVETINRLKDRGIGFKCLTQDFLDTTTPNGMLVFHIFAAVAEFERSLIRERTKSGLEAARARNRLIGRPKAQNNHRIEMAKTLYNDGKSTVTQICKTLNISRATFYRDLKAKMD